VELIFIVKELLDLHTSLSRKVMEMIGHIFYLFLSVLNETNYENGQAQENPKKSKVSKNRNLATKLIFESFVLGRFQMNRIVKSRKLDCNNSF
jgi:hypothetical protein